MACTFCQIVRGERSEEVVHRTDRFVVFPPATQRAGKLLIVPASHYESLEEIAMSDLGQWMQEAKDLASKLKTGSYKIQINVVADLFQGKHIYMQFSYAEGQKEAKACHPLSASKGASLVPAQTTGPGLSQGLVRRSRVT